MKKRRNRKGTFKGIGLANAATQELVVESNHENQPLLTANSIEHYIVVIGTLMALEV